VAAAHLTQRDHRVELRHLADERGELDEAPGEDGAARRERGEGR
jgi:hypothetical protein